jgi:hypothetical protein
MGAKEFLRIITCEKIYNRLRRYQKRLVVEGLRLVKEKEIDLKVREDRGIRTIDGPPTIWVGEEKSDFGDIIELAKE